MHTSDLRATHYIQPIFISIPLELPSKKKVSSLDMNIYFSFSRHTHTHAHIF